MAQLLLPDTSSLSRRRRELPDVLDVKKKRSDAAVVRYQVGTLDHLESGCLMPATVGSFTKKLGQSITHYGDRRCIEFGKRWYSGTDVNDYVTRIAGLLRDAGIADDAPVGLVVRNTVPSAAAILGFIAENRSVAMIYSYQSPESIARDIEALGLAAIVADTDDWTEIAVTAARRVGSVGVGISLQEPTVGIVPGLEFGAGVDKTGHRGGDPGLYILTSGTTGPPKRLPIEMAALERAVLSATAGQPGTSDDPPDLVYWPFGSIGGVAQLLAAAYQGKAMVLLEKFTVDEWVRAVRTYGITQTAVHPAVIRMLLDADIASGDLASLQFITGGSGPLEPETRDAFEHRFGVPVLWAYGATEFAGSVCAWTPDLLRKHGDAKRHSVGKPLPGADVRVVNPNSGAAVGPGLVGHLEARIPLIGPDWIRTTDLAEIDADGFVTVHGRGDGAINRGGFKILPEVVRSSLLNYPGVRDACVVGVADLRLGEVPFAAVEMTPGAAIPSEDDLKAMIRRSLPRHHVPVAIVVVHELPRNPSLKADLRAVAALYQDRAR